MGLYISLIGKLSLPRDKQTHEPNTRVETGKKEIVLNIKEDIIHKMFFVKKAKL